MKQKKTKAEKHLDELEKPKFIFDDADYLVKSLNPPVAGAKAGRVALVPRGNKIEFATWSHDGQISFFSKYHAETLFAQYQLSMEGSKGKSKLISGFGVWLKSPDRKQFERAVFNPNLKDAEEKPHELNLFEGFAVKPKKGEWGKLKAHLLENVCNNNKEHFDYLMSWMSQMFFEPERKSGVCVVLRGEQGVGKSKLGDWLRIIVGERHSRTISNPDHIAGKFNSLVMNTIFALVEEAPFAGDPTKRNVLAHIITNHELAYEMKGVDAEDGKNYTRFMIVSNAEWVAPVEAGDRRCFVIDVSETHKEDKDYFIEIDDEMKLGGAEAMLYDLLELKVRMRDMGKPPMTAAKREQMVLGLKPDMAWLSDVLAAGEFPYADGRTLAWPETGQWKGEQPCPTQDVEAWGLVKKDDVAESFRDFVSTHRGRATSIRVGRFLTKIFPEIRTIRITQERNRPWAYQLPPLEAARKRFLKFNPAFEPMIEPMIDPGSDKPKEQSADAPEASIEDIAAYRSRRSRF